MNRINKLCGVVLTALALLCLRLCFLSVYQGERLAKQAVFQRTENISIKTVRGVIYDRNMLAITEGQSRLHAAVIPRECANLDKASRLIGQRISEGEDIQVFELDAVTEEQAQLVGMRGISLFNVSERYDGAGILSHVIGYTSDNGGFGIEKAFNKELAIEQNDSISMIKNANRKMMTGLGYNKANKRTYQGVKLSIDYHIQQIAENAVDKGIKSGAAIVVDIKTGGIAAMVSRPNFKQTELAKYLSSNKGELLNRAIMPYDIGSVFKVVLAAAALEEGFYTPGASFECRGMVDISGREFVCNNREGHGILTLEQGLAHSCNVVFYTVGQRLGAEKILRYAKDFGFGERVLEIDGLNEDAGHIPASEFCSPQDIANISIGQGTVAATPLQIADMLCTIANDGVRRRLTLVNGIVDENGNAKDIKPADIGRVISRKTAAALKGMLKSVVKYGTGTGADIEGWGAGGKTGSAETGWVMDGETMTHGWFAGFFPADKPRYVCVVLAENGKTGAASAAPVFREMGRGIKNLNR